MSTTYAHKKQQLYLVLSGIFLVNALLAEIIGVKIFSVEKTFGLSGNLTAGVLVWPVESLLTADPSRFRLSGFSLLLRRRCAVACHPCKLPCRFGNLGRMGDDAHSPENPAPASAPRGRDGVLAAVGPRLRCRTGAVGVAGEGFEPS